jgi:tetratricopeptide (TPR) repeat protein
VPIRSIKINSGARKALLIAALAAAIGASYFFGKWAMADMASTHADVVEVADLAISLGPDDPQTHYAAAVLYEKSFLPEDIARGLGEYVQAATLSPNNYLLWLDLGNARGRDGDLAGAERALRIAEKLAPNYSSVQWSLGNILLRQEKTGEAFASIQKAAVANPAYAPAGANLAWQYFGGDIPRIHDAVGDSPAIVGALVPLLSGQNRDDEALSFWNALADPKMEAPFKQIGSNLAGALVAKKRYRDATRVEADISADKPEIGKIGNGGFEGDIRTQAASPFEWAITDGNQPQIALTDGQKHSGGKSLVIVFSQNGTNDFRQISQTVAVEPGRAYQLNLFYKGDMQTSTSLQWEIVDGSDGKILASTSKIISVQDWTQLNASFVTPATTDGIIIRFAKNGCSPGVCPVTGRVWFDDLVLNEK